MKIKTITALLAVAASSVLPLSAQDAAPAPVPAPVATPEQAATPAPVAETKEAAPAAPAAPALKLADINPALRGYLLETAACLLDAGAMGMDQYAATGKKFEEMGPQDLFPVMVDAIKKTSTEALPADFKPFMDGVVTIATQAGTELASMPKDMTGADAAMEKYQAPLMELIQKNPAIVQLAMQIQGSAESLMAELGLTQAMLMETMMLSAQVPEDPTKLPAFTAKLREIATLLRAKK